MKATSKKIEKMMSALEAYNNATDAYNLASSNLKNEYYDYDLGNGKTIKRMTEESVESSQHYLDTYEERKKAQKAAAKAIISAAESLGITVKANLKREDNLKPTALRIKARFEAAVEVINHISRYDEYLEPNHREYIY